MGFHGSKTHLSVLNTLIMNQTRIQRSFSPQKGRDTFSDMTTGRTGGVHSAWFSESTSCDGFCHGKPHMMGFQPSPVLGCCNLYHGWDVLSRDLPWFLHQLVHHPAFGGPDSGGIPGSPGKVWLPTCARGQRACGEVKLEAPVAKSSCWTYIYNLTADILNIFELL